MAHNSEGLSLDALTSLKKTATAGRADTAGLIAAHRAEICIPDNTPMPKCDVIVVFRGRELSLRVVTTTRPSNGLGSSARHTRSRRGLPSNARAPCWQNWALRLEGRAHLKPCHGRSPRQSPKLRQNNPSARILINPNQCQAPRAKIFCWSRRANHWQESRTPARKRGVSRSPRYVGPGGDGRFCSADDRTGAYGEVVWSWRRDAGVKL